MNYVEGTDGAHLIRRYPAGLPVGQVAGIFSAIAAALDYAQRSCCNRERTKLAQTFCSPMLTVYGLILVVPALERPVTMRSAEQ